MKLHFKRKQTNCYIYFLIILVSRLCVLGIESISFFFFFAQHKHRRFGMYFIRRYFGLLDAFFFLAIFRFVFLVLYNYWEFNSKYLVYWNDFFLLNISATCKIKNVFCCQPVLLTRFLFFIFLLSPLSR